MVGKVRHLTIRRSQRLAVKLYSCDENTQTRTSKKVMSQKLCTGILTVFDPITTRISEERGNRKRKSVDDNVQDEMGMLRKKVRPATTSANGPRRSPRLQNEESKRNELVTPSNPKIICCPEVQKPSCKKISRETANSEQKKVTNELDIIKKIQMENQNLKVKNSKLEKELGVMKTITRSRTKKFRDLKIELEAIRDSKDYKGLVTQISERPLLQPNIFLNRLNSKSPPPPMIDLPVKSRKVRRQPIQPMMSSRVLRSHCANRCLESREADVFEVHQPMTPTDTAAEKFVADEEALSPENESDDDEIEEYDNDYDTGDIGELVNEYNTDEIVEHVNELDMRADGGPVVEIDDELKLISHLPSGEDIDIDESENEDGDDSESHDKLPETYIKANRILDKYLLTHLKGNRTNEKVILASQTIATLIVSESRLWIQKYLNREFRFLLSRAHERLVPLWIIEAFFGAFVEGAKEFTSHFKTNRLGKYIAEAFENYKMEHSDGDDISSLWVKCLKEMELAKARVIKTTRRSEQKQLLGELNQ